ncbi:putative nucleotidyltransferase with HDIG domain [Halanaerobium saccharolyticum]|uniref:Putative nucleotidyltransferase with HDIG domain n=1 Tax=Halanaerobium saccharolyticum TaxID=43595 RepID=A0A4R6LZW1_9FIRM|nr:HD domain-containing phosphohydrolase [Halanaerobium saccharolyticum]TDO94383.1 putative nucleotidyltransferase with HDIG domain [Halanaerobium saccharolyticum]
MSNFKDRLRTLRKNMDLTQDKLADKLNYSRSTIAQYERGIRIPSNNFLIEVANFFEVSLDYLMGLKNVETRKKNNKLNESLIYALSKMHSTKIFYKNFFSQNVAALALEIGKFLSLSSKNLELLNIAALLHDIGEIYLPSEIINKNRKLTEAEFKLIETHPKLSYDLLKDVKFDPKIKNIILQHHEKVDGSGYPEGLKGKMILKEAKIITAADSIIAMLSERPYRKAYSKKEALRILAKNKNIKYDPEIVEICIEVFKNNIFSLIND